jgi:hypothetical protein
MRPRGPPAYSERADLLTMTMSLAGKGRQAAPPNQGQDARLPYLSPIASGPDPFPMSRLSTGAPASSDQGRALSSNPWTWA